MISATHNFDRPEIGVVDINMAAAAKDDILFADYPATIKAVQWGCIPEYKSALESSLGGNALAEFDKVAQTNMAEMNRLAERLYNNFKKIV